MTTFYPFNTMVNQLKGEEFEGKKETSTVSIPRWYL